MKEGRRSTGFIKNVIFGILILLSALAAVIKLSTGFDIDEAYALAMPYRVLQGDRLFSDMWEVHQTSVFLPYICMRLFSVFSEDMTYLVLYMRCITCVMHLGMSMLVFLSGKHFSSNNRWNDSNNCKSCKNSIPTVATLIYFNFLPKWMMNLDFSMQQLWFFTLFLIFLLKGWEQVEKENRKKRALFLFLAGLMLAMDVLAYPGMIILYPAALILLSVNKTVITAVWDSIWITLGCALAAGLFFLFVFSYMSPSEFLTALSGIFMDGAHQYDAATKLSLYLSQWAEVLVQALILIVPVLCILAAVYAFYEKSKWGKRLRERYGKLSYGLLFCILFETEVSAVITLAGFFVTWGPFRLQVRYIIQFVMAGILLLCECKKTSADSENKCAANCCFLSGIWWLSLAAFAGILLASNVGPTSSASYLIPGNILFVGLTILLAKKYGKMMERLSYAGAVLFLLSLLMCKGFYMRITEYVPGDITQGLSKIEEGPLSGVFVRNEDYERLVSDYHTIREAAAKSDRVLFMGTESLSNLYSGGRLVGPTTISTPAFNEQWVEYFTTHQDKIPTVIFLAKNTVDDREKFFAKNPFGIWIAKYYDVEGMEETESLCILRPTPIRK